MTTRLMHVANGTSTTGIIREAGLPGESSIWADVLHEGPVPPRISDEELVRVRARHLAAESGQSDQQIVAELERWRAAIDGGAYDEMVLWFEHDLFDQLNLIQLLERISRTRPRSAVVTLICIGSFPGRERFKGLGELRPDELATLFDTRQPVTDAQYALATRAWQAFRSPDPRDIETLLEDETSALPFLREALPRHLEEFPSIVDGLSRTERTLMSFAAAEPVDIRSTFQRMHDSETAFYIGDASFWKILQELGSTSPALLELRITRDAAEGLPRGTAALTDTGRDVLAGRVDRVRRCGIDRWLGGVHLQGSGPIWRWNPAQSRIVRA